MLRCADFDDHEPLMRLLTIVPTMTRRRALPGTKIRMRIEQRIH
jgi:hypothetical protein